MKRSQPKRSLGRIKRKARPRRVSTKRAAINRVAGDWRREFKQEIGRCELCLKQKPILDCHEITRGPGRVLALMCRSAILVLCRSCHDVIGDKPLLWTVARQAALLRSRRPADYCLDTLNGMLTRRVTEADVVSETNLPKENVCTK